MKATHNILELIKQLESVEETIWLTESILDDMFTQRLTVPQLLVMQRIFRELVVIAKLKEALQSVVSVEIVVVED